MKALNSLALFLFSQTIIAAEEVLSKCVSETFDTSAIDAGCKVLSVEAKEQRNYTSLSGFPLPTGLNFCQVKVYVTHHTASGATLDYDKAKDKVMIEAWLPLTEDDWNGRFQATGGGGLATGMFDPMLAFAVQGGWAAVSTDGGREHGPHSVFDGSWATREDRSINWNLLHNFASRSLVDQIAIGKSITAQYFGKQPRHSYWNGCSTGGRQGYAIAQRYPHLLDGILANAPAINFPHLVTAMFWPQLQMKILNTYISNCEFNYYLEKSVEHCDMLDGVRDGVLMDPEQCDFDPYSLVKKEETFECDGEKVEFTHEMAQLIEQMHKGPGSSRNSPIYYGYAHGVALDVLANITTSAAGVRSQNPFPLVQTWLKYFLFQDPAFNLTNLDLASYMELFGSASYEFGGLLSDDSPDLSALKASGTKLLTWHGLADVLIPYQSTVAYRKRVEGVMGGAHEVDNFYRLFLAPGVGHCYGGKGPVPKDPLSALVDWVEHDTPPQVLEAATTDETGDLVTRDLCAWPAKSKYMGVSDAKRASSWSCEGGTETLSTANNPREPGRAQQILDGLAERLGGLRGLIIS